MPWQNGRGYMTDNACGGRDPAFFFHHANVDRLWQLWKNVDSERTDPINTDAWQNFQFPFFDTDGQMHYQVPCDAVNASAMGYAYTFIDAEDGSEGIMPVLNVRPCAQSSTGTDSNDADDDANTASGHYYRFELFVV